MHVHWVNRISPWANSHSAHPENTKSTHMLSHLLQKEAALYLRSFSSWIWTLIMSIQFWISFQLKVSCPWDNASCLTESSSSAYLCTRKQWCHTHQTSPTPRSCPKSQVSPMGRMEMLQPAWQRGRQFVSLNLTTDCSNKGPQRNWNSFWQKEKWWRWVLYLICCFCWLTNKENCLALIGQKIK